MDERKIAELFDDAVPDAPPPSFGADEVLAESARLTRRRNGALAGTALGVVLLAGVAVAGFAVSSEDSGAGGSPVAAVAPGNAEGATSTSPNGVQDSNSPRVLTDPSGSGPTNAPSTPPKQGGGPTGGTGGSGGEAGGTPGGCAEVDRELAAALAGGLPAPSATSGDYVRSPLACPPGARSAAFSARNGPTRGLVSIMLVPAGARQLQQPPWDSRPDGTLGVVVQTRSGAQLVIAEEPVAGTTDLPLDDAALRGIGDELAPTL